MWESYKNNLIDKLKYSWIFIITGASCLALSVYTYNSRIVYLATAKYTMAEVKSLASEKDSKGSTAYAPIYAFQDEEGKTWQIKSNTSSNPPQYAVGDKIRIYYQVNNPENSVIDGFFELWLLSAVFLFIGVLHSVLGVIGILLDRKFKNKGKIV